MLWTPLSHRLEHLPLLLAGPILRRTEADTVTVWVALQEACEVTLEVYGTEASGLTIAPLILQGSRHTIALGQHFHPVAITAKPTGEAHLQPGQLYAYNLVFRKPDGQAFQSTASHPPTHQQTLQQALSSTLFPQIPISYFEHQLPTFSLPPQDLTN